MIELELDKEHTVDDARLAALIGEQEGTIANAYFLHPMAFSDCLLYTSPSPRDS